MIARYDGNANGFHLFLCRRFIGHHLDLSRRRADEDGPCFNARCGEKRILRQKTIARMHRAGAGAPYRVNDVLSAKVAVSSSVRAYSERLVCLRHMQ